MAQLTMASANEAGENITLPPGLEHYRCMPLGAEEEDHNDHRVQRFVANVPILEIAYLRVRDAIRASRTCRDRLIECLACPGVASSFKHR